MRCFASFISFAVVVVVAFFICLPFRFACHLQQQVASPTGRGWLPRFDFALTSLYEPYLQSAGLVHCAVQLVAPPNSRALLSLIPSISALQLLAALHGYYY